jgi:hypothetical protein
VIHTARVVLCAAHPKLQGSFVGTAIVVPGANQSVKIGGRMLKRSAICCAIAIVLVNLGFAQSSADKEKALKYGEHEAGSD